MQEQARPERVAKPSLRALVGEARRVRREQPARRELAAQQARLVRPLELAAMQQRGRGEPEAPEGRRPAEA
jgi:hypothetical protein